MLKWIVRKLADYAGLPDKEYVRRVQAETDIRIDGAFKLLRRVQAETDIRIDGAFKLLENHEFLLHLTVPIEGAKQLEHHDRVSLRILLGLLAHQVGVKFTVEPSRDHRVHCVGVEEPSEVTSANGPAPTL